MMISILTIDSERSITGIDGIVGIDSTPSIVQEHFMDSTVGTIHIVSIHGIVDLIHGIVDSTHGIADSILGTVDLVAVLQVVTLVLQLGEQVTLIIL